ncbi:hypothetical protein WJX72_012337 [[Myrmecia] bisecta]|uniref:Uncharacterized protein n=1 Tax=[Myrmecia] bisecta TaxID=41462 RepID=A0AAW1PRC2_9CHLO
MPGEHGSRARRASTAEPALSALTKRLRPIAHHAPAGSPSPDNLQAVDSIEQPAAKPTVPADLLPELVERRSTALAEDRQDGYAQLNDEQLEAVEADAQYLADMTLEAHQDELATRRAADTSKAAPGGNGHGLQLAGWPPPPADQHAQQFHTMLEGFDPFDMRTPLKLRGQDRAHSPIRPISPPGVPDWLDPNTSLKVLRPHTAEVHARMPKVVQLGVSKPQEKVRCPDVHRVPPTMRDYMEAFD